MGIEDLKNLFTPKENLIGSQKRAEQVSKEDEIRFRNIAIKVIEVLTEHSVTVREIPTITQIVIAIVNKKIDNADIEKVIKDL